MRVRTLPPEEWEKLKVTGMPHIGEHVPRDDVRVVVVEKDDQVVACVSLYRALHWEGTWIDEGNRNAGVTRALLKGIEDASWDLGHDWAFCSVDDEKMAHLLEKLNGADLKCRTFAVPTVREEKKSA